jgi:hypothetical protein
MEPVSPPEKTPAQRVALQLQGGDGPEDPWPKRRIILVISASSLAMVEAMADKARRSRNFMLNNLMAVGVQSVIDALPESERDEVQLDWLERCGQLEEAE